MAPDPVLFHRAEPAAEPFDVASATGDRVSAPCLDGRETLKVQVRRPCRRRHEGRVRCTVGKTRVAFG